MDSSSPPLEQAWITLSEARSLFGATSDDVIRYWVDQNYLCSRVTDTGERLVLRDDVLRRKEMYDRLGAIGGDEMTDEQLDVVRRSRPGTAPWNRPGDAVAPAA